jgi:hypothetical protein
LIQVQRRAHRTEPIQDGLWRCVECDIKAEAHDPVAWSWDCVRRPLRVVTPDDESYGWVRPEDEGLAEDCAHDAGRLVLCARCLDEVSE